MSEKTEKPTPKRIRDARKDGQVAKSQEISGLIQLSIILVWLILEAPTLYTDLGDFFRAVINTTNLSLDNAIMVLTGDFELIWIKFVFNMAIFLVPVLVLTGLLQTGFLFAPKALKPSAKRINPLSNAKQMVSVMKLFEFFKMFLKVGILSLTFTYLIEKYAASFSQLTKDGLVAGLLICCKMILWMCSILIVVTAIFSIIDYIMQRRQLMKQLMMSLDDIKQEYKNTEGNQEIKHRRRELHREIQSGSLSKKISKSTLVVRNPTHIAVCLRYEQGITPLPEVVEYGQDARALLIVSLAEKMEIPIVENIPLARALFKVTRPGDYIPRELFVAVAQVLRALQENAQEESNKQAQPEIQAETKLDVASDVNQEAEVKVIREE